MTWHRTRRGDLGLRALGTGACALSCASIGHLLRWHDADPVHWSPGIAAWLLTAIGFLCASGGSGLVLLGSHLFDEIVISERWRTRPLVEDAEADPVDGGPTTPPLPDGPPERAFAGRILLTPPCSC
ncbi:hypothetical protein [Sphingomonas bacterium]|uniref:hypothetical protein n=1 Tax=Sphingomonas bacterium TaxID=1895847 RepID=UPI001576B714|nr:hypothetical protein [Sphingomonas bacterium]